MHSDNHQYSFLSGGGEMGELTRNKDWDSSSLGNPDKWPQSLRTTLSIILNSKFPMFLFWGPEFICFYNDAYRPSLGIEGKHPGMLGIPGKEAWPEIWDIIYPLIRRVMDKGESTWSEDQLIPIYRNGKIEDVYWTFSYSPVNDESGRPAGVFVACTENTRQVIALGELRNSRDEFEFAIEAAELGTFEYIPATNKFSANPRLKSWFGLPGDDQLDLQFAIHAIAEKDRERVVKAIREAIDFSTQIPFDIQYSIIHPVTRLETVVHAKGKSWFRENEPIAYRFNGTLRDITENSSIEKERQQLISIIDASSEFVSLAGLDKKLRYINPSGLRMLGWETYTGREITDFIFPPDRILGQQLLSDLLDKGSFQHEIRFWNKATGQSFWIHWNGFIIKDLLTGEITGLATVSPNITEQKSADQALKESENKLRTFIMESPIPKAILRGRELVVELANAAILRNIWNKTESEVIGRKLLDIFPKLAEQKYPALLENVFETGRSHSESESLITFEADENAQRFYVDFEYAPLFDAGKSVSGIRITAINVTEKVQARKQIEESEKRFRSLAENLPQLIWETDENGIGLYASRRWEEYTGVSPITEDDWRFIVHPDDFEQNSAVWKRSLSTGEIYKCDLRIKSKSGDYRWHAVVGEPVYNNENKISKWVGAFTDIHSEKNFTQELEKQISIRTQELDNTNKALEQNNRELQAINKELQSFAYISSHDLQEPLRKIQTFSSRIIENESANLSPKGREYFERMSKSAMRMQSLIDDLLAYSRTQVNDGKFEEVKLSSIINDVKTDLAEEMKQINMSVSLKGDCTLHGTPFQLRQLFYNLFTNSIKFAGTSQKPLIRIEVDDRPGKNTGLPKLTGATRYVHVSFTDNGIGFEPQYNEKVFELFQRLHGRSEYAGTGIGLAIVKKIVENHKGAITANGSPDHGVRFDIYFPQDEK